jgi:hypothetical protein
MKQQGRKREAFEEDGQHTRGALDSQSDSQETKGNANEQNNIQGTMLANRVTFKSHRRL